MRFCIKWPLKKFWAPRTSFDPGMRGPKVAQRSNLENLGFLIDFCHRMTCKCAQLPPIPIINITKCIKKVHLEKRALKHTKFVILARKTLKQHIFDKILRLIDYFFVCLDNTIQLKEKHSSEGHTGSINTSKPLKTYFFTHFMGKHQLLLGHLCHMGGGQNPPLDKYFNFFQYKHSMFPFFA